MWMNVLLAARRFAILRKNWNYFLQRFLNECEWDVHKMEFWNLKNRICHWNRNKTNTLLLRCLCVLVNHFIWSLRINTKRFFAQTLEITTILINSSVNIHSLLSIQHLRTILAEKWNDFNLLFTLSKKKAHINVEKKTENEIKLKTKSDEK